MNAGLSGKLPCINSAWRVYVDNITDKNYEEEYGYPQAGRTFRAELQYNF
jgi:outer membrane receptor protein involved in Fe transport